MWKDISSFSKNDKDRAPRTFQLSLGRMEVVVTRHIHFGPDDWVLNCEPFASGVVISKGSADEAKAAAVKFIRRKLEEAIAALPNAA